MMMKIQETFYPERWMIVAFKAITAKDGKEGLKKLDQ